METKLKGGVGTQSCPLLPEILKKGKIKSSLPYESRGKMSTSAWVQGPNGSLELLNCQGNMQGGEKEHVGFTEQLVLWVCPPWSPGLPPV